MLLKSNAVLNEHLLAFCQLHLEPLGHVGYYHIDWAGQAGSNRTFYRLRMPRDAGTVILVEWPGDDHDWDYFLALQQQPELENLIPRMIGLDRISGFMIMTDCGERSIKDLFFSNPKPEQHKLLIEKVLVKLFEWQNTKLTKNSHIHNRQFDTEALLWETDYFQEHLCDLFPRLKPLFDVQWQTEREALAEKVDGFQKVLMHRDFQAENIVMHDGVVRFIDVQGVRVGPGEYDIASLLYDPYLTPHITKGLRDSMLELCSIHYGGPEVIERINYSGMQRLMQALGAYGNLSLNMGKPRYKQFVKPALDNLSILLETLEGYDQIKLIVKSAREFA